MDDPPEGPAPGQRAVSRRQFLRLGCGSLLSAVTVSVLGPVYATQVEPHWIEVTRVDVPLPDWPAALDGFTIAHLSDSHLGPYVSAGNVRRSVQLANELNADAVARNLTEAGIVVLRDKRRAFDIGGTRLWLLGIEDAGYTGFRGSSFDDFQARWRGAKDALARLLEGVPDAEPRLLLVHNPDFTEMLPEGSRPALTLCGHTHGGQVRLPLIGAPVVPSCFGRKYASGLVRGPDTWVYVNRGIGVIAPPVRFNCRPEVTLLRLTHRNS